MSKPKSENVQWERLWLWPSQPDEILPKGEHHEISPMECICQPEIIVKKGRTILLHNSYDRREVHEWVQDILKSEKPHA